MSEQLNPLEQLLHFLAELENEKLSYRFLSSGAVTTVVQVALPRERWRLEFHPDGQVAFMFFEGQAVRDGLDDFWFAVLGDRAREEAKSQLPGERRAAPFEQQLIFMQIMRKEGIHVTLASHRNALMFEIDVPDQFWEVEFFGDGSIDSDQFLLKQSESSGGLRDFWIAASEER